MQLQGSPKGKGFPELKKAVFGTHSACGHFCQYWGHLFRNHADFGYFEVNNEEILIWGGKWDRKALLEAES